MNRFKDSRQTIYSFFERFLVKCPVCNSVAIVVRSDNNQGIFAARKFSCKICGAAKKNSNTTIIISETYASYFNYPLWLSAPCCGNILRA